MFSPDDITPEAIDALVADFDALLALSSLDTRGPVARVRGAGAALSVQTVGGDIYIWTRWFCHELPASVVPQLRAMLDPDSPTARAALLDADGSRSLVLQRTGDTVTVSGSIDQVTVRVDDLSRALVRAGIFAEVSAR